MKKILQRISNPQARDALVYAAYLARINFSGLKGAAAMVAKRGLLKFRDDLHHYPWLLSLSNYKQVYDDLTLGRTGLYREASALALALTSETFNEIFSGMINRPHETVMIEDNIPPDIILGMGLNPWVTEFAGMLLPTYDSRKSQEYIDVAENEGIPPDLCSLTKITMGMILKDHLPHPLALVSTNMPCDGGMMQYALIEREIKAPTFYLDAPFNFFSYEAVDYFVIQLKKMIAWLEEHTPGRMDWDRMREICTQRNKSLELQRELWDLLRAKPAPMAAETIILSSVGIIANPGSPRNTMLFKRLLEMAKANLAAGNGALSDERYRLAIWNPAPPPIYMGIFRWIEEAYGIALLMDMVSFNRHPFIDTKTPETMLRDLARIMMQLGMAGHTRGPAENFWGNLFHIYNLLNLDMIWITGHVGCKNTQALFGILREKCREQNIPLLIIDLDVLDSRVVSVADIRRQVETFMETVMNATPLEKKEKAYEKNRNSNQHQQP